MRRFDSGSVHATAAGAVSACSRFRSGQGSLPHATMKRPIQTAVSVMLAALLVGGMAMAFTGGATAGSVDSEIEYDSTTKLSGESYSGQVQAIEVGVSGSASWENLPSKVDYVTVTMATNSGEDKAYQRFAGEKYQDVPSSRTGSFEFHGLRNDVLESTDFESEPFSADEDGEVQKRMFPVKVTITAHMENGETKQHVQYHKIRTNVENLAKPSLDANKTIDGKIIMADDGHGDYHGTEDDQAGY